MFFILGLVKCHPVISGDSKPFQTTQPPHQQFTTGNSSTFHRSIYFESLPYRVHPETGLIDFDELRKTAPVAWGEDGHIWMVQ